MGNIYIYLIACLFVYVQVMSNQVHWLSLTCPGFLSRAWLSLMFPTFPSRKPCFSIRCTGFPSHSRLCVTCLAFPHVPCFSVTCPAFPSGALVFPHVPGFLSRALAFPHAPCLSVTWPAFPSGALAFRLIPALCPLLLHQCLALRQLPTPVFLHLFHAHTNT